MATPNVPRYFECLHCGVVTPTNETAPRCVECGHGTGVLHTADPGKKTDAAPAKHDREDSRGGSTKPR